MFMFATVALSMLHIPFVTPLAHSYLASVQSKLIMDYFSVIEQAAEQPASPELPPGMTLTIEK